VVGFYYYHFYLLVICVFSSHLFSLSFPCLALVLFFYISYLIALKMWSPPNSRRQNQTTLSRTCKKYPIPRIPLKLIYFPTIIWSLIFSHTVRNRFQLTNSLLPLESHFCMQYSDSINWITTIYLYSHFVHVFLSRTVSEVRSFDETTIHPATRRPAHYYQSDVSQGYFC